MGRKRKGSFGALGPSKRSFIVEGLEAVLDPERTFAFGE